MARRREVFESKVLQKLYPPAPKLEERSSSSIVETLAKKTCVKRKPTQSDADVVKTQSGVGAGRRMYTVLPPPADYKADPEKSVPLPEPEGIKNGEDTAEESDRDSSEESEQDKEEEVAEKRRRKRRKKKATPRQSCGEGAGPGSESGPGTGQRQTPVDGAGDRISKNKKRKLKKKRHKEKLLSMGLMPRAAALEFTYKKAGEEEEEDDEKGAAEVSDFLKTTMEIYKSDSSLRDSDELTALSATLDDLLRRPASVLQRLHRLKACVRRKQTERLDEELKELRRASPLSPEETSAVVLLFQYWITDILPMQGDEKTELSASHP